MALSPPLPLLLPRLVFPLSFGEQTSASPSLLHHSADRRVRQVELARDVSGWVLRVFGGPTSLDAGGQGGTDGPKRGFLFGVGLCSTTFPIILSL